MPKYAPAVASATPCCPAPVSAISFFFAEIFREQRFAHAVVELVRARVVQVFALQVDAAAADAFRQVFAVVNRRRASLKMFADAAQFLNEVVRAADRMIRVGDFVHLLLQFRRNVGSAEFSEKSLGVGKSFVSGKLFVVHNNRKFYAPFPRRERKKKLAAFPRFFFAETKGRNCGGSGQGGQLSGSMPRARSCLRWRASETTCAISVAIQ